MKRIEQIDGLRGIAILLVMCFHFIYDTFRVLPSKLFKFFAQLFSFGWFGVDLFFVISGFLIGSILLSNKNKKNYFKTFYLRRFFRIVPIYFLLLFVFIIIPYLTTHSLNFSAINSNIPLWSYFTLTQNIYMAMQNSLGTSTLSVTWSIAIEEQFYLIIPFIIYFISTKYLPLVAILCIVLANIFRHIYHSPINWVPSYVLLHCRMDCIAFGLLIAYINFRIGIEKFVSMHQYKIYLGLIISALYSIIMFYLFKDLGILRNTIFGIIFSSITILSLANKESLLSRFLCNSKLNWIGKISYSLYLFHLLIFGSLKLIAIDYYHIAPYTVVITLSSLSFLFSFIICWLIYKFIETPTVAVGKKFNYIN